MPMVAFLNANGSYTNGDTFTKYWELYDGVDASPRDTIFNFINSCRSTLKTFTLSDCSYDEGSPALSGSLTNLFRNCFNLTEINFLCGEGEITNISDMFYNCCNLASIKMPNWTISNVANMYNVFYNCYNLTSLDVSNWNTGNVINIDMMFYNCHNLTSLDISNWNTGKIISMYDVFYNCYNLTSLDVSNWNVNNVTNMRSMFYNCYNLTSLDISNWKIGNVTSMRSMFYNCYNLKTIYIDSNNWQLNTSLNTFRMFYGCFNLIGRKGTSYVSSKVDGSYARVDDGPDLPGYFCGVYNMAVGNVPIKDAYFRGQKVNKAILGRDLLNLIK